MLPADLRTAETELLEAVRAALAKGGRGLWTAELRFEGLRILPVALRLLANLQPQVAGIRLLCADAGATALAKRDAPDLADSISSLSRRWTYSEAAQVASLRCSLKWVNSEGRWADSISSSSSSPSK